MLFFSFHFTAILRSSPFSQPTMESRDALPLKRLPASQFASDALVCRFVALEPMPLLPEVQNGTTVLPEKS